MPELGEVAHATSVLRRFLAGKVIKSVVAQEDPIVFVQPLTKSILEQSLVGKKLETVDRHGKIFWAHFQDYPKKLVMHFGMTGWFVIKGYTTEHIVMENGGDKTALALKKSEESLETQETKPPAEVPPAIIKIDEKDQQWPPRFWKFQLSMDDGTEMAFIDARRLGRVRIIDAKDNEELYNQEPLKRSGPDYSKPGEALSEEAFLALIAKRTGAIKSLLMDQALFAGIGNWLADEVLYQARIHPAQVANSIPEEKLKVLREKLINICMLVAKVEGNTQAFPRDWLMLYRWGKGRKGQKQKTAEGFTVEHVTVGGRTSSFVPELQKLSKAAAVVKRKQETTTTTKIESRAEKAKESKVKRESYESNEEQSTKKPPIKKAKTTKRTTKTIKTSEVTETARTTRVTRSSTRSLIKHE